jgi:hypothetical protein
MFCAAAIEGKLKHLSAMMIFALTEDRGITVKIV